MWLYLQQIEYQFVSTRETWTVV